jgi:uncharacterized protein YkwD
MSYGDGWEGEPMKKILNPRVLAGVLMTMLIFTFTPASALTSDTYETQTASRTNVKRVERDKVRLRYQSCVDKYAERQARWLASHGYLKHQNLRTVLDNCNLTGVAENIAYGFSSGYRVVTAFMNSPGHRRNLLNSKMRYIGVGAVQDENGTWWVSQVFGTRK